MGHRFLLLTAVLAVSLEAAFGTFTRGIGLNGQYYTGAGVGPLGLFRSTAENAAIVKEGFTGHPLGRFLALAYGDEFPNLRDDVIRRLKQQAERNSISTSSGGSGGAARSGGLFGLLDGPYGAVISPQNWMFDRENNKKELNDPYRRPGLLSSITGGGSGGGSGGGLLSSVTGLLSSFRGSSGSGGSGGGLSSLLGGLGGLGGSSSSSSSSSSGSSGFRITADTPTRAPSITSVVAELEKADDTASENETNNPAAE